MNHKTGRQAPNEMIDQSLFRVANRPRRNRRTAAIRDMVRENYISPANLILPVFVHEKSADEPIGSMPGRSRQSLESIVATAREAASLGVNALALFPALEDEFKDTYGQESLNPDGFLQRVIRAIKAETPNMLVVGDVALDPYSSDGHDGVVIDGRIDNDETVPILAAMAVNQARAGADIVAPSDMMDGRVGAIRQALDSEGFTDVAICSYCVKFASGFYGPFREALDSAPRSGDKKTYQMDPGNAREALRELYLDEEEGADMVMVKPGLPYLDVIRLLRENTSLPVAAYHVSGEYAMLKAASERGWLDYNKCLLESLLCMRRAGADMIFTYGALDAARLLG